jgi:hypothetical protein
MVEATIPQRVNEVLATLIDIFRHQQKAEVVELLESAHAHFDEIDYDNWNGGTYTWALRLEVPVRVFAAVEPRLAAVEADISSKLAYFDRQYPNDHLGEITVVPFTAGASPVGQRTAPSDIEVRRLWPDGFLRLFLSHVSKHKVAVSKLKDTLRPFGVAAFVAHEDIEPSLEWQREIEVGLRSMHAVAALITPDFHSSNWTDQEIGWALGRDILVVPVRLGADPYGFAGKFQGVSGILDQPEVLAELLVKTLLNNQKTTGEMRRAMVGAFTKATSPNAATRLCRFLVRSTDLTEDEKDILRQACTDNPEVANAAGVVEALYAVIGAPPAPNTMQKGDEIPF